jgi:hypothetical protein
MGLADMNLSVVHPRNFILGERLQEQNPAGCVCVWLECTLQGADPSEN